MEGVLALLVGAALASLEGVVRQGVTWAGSGREDGHPPPLDRGLPLGEASTASLPSLLGGVHESPPLERTVMGAGVDSYSRPTWCVRGVRVVRAWRVHGVCMQEGFDV
jgi:hypothetical protein